MSGGWRNFWHTTVFPELNFYALHQGCDAYLHINRLRNSFYKLSHGTSLLHYHIQNKSPLIKRISFVSRSNKLLGVRNHNKPQLIRILQTQTSTILTKKFPAGNLTARVTYKLQVDVPQNIDFSGPMYFCISYFSMVINISSKLLKEILNPPV
jgi:hypothetical protein